MGSILTSLPKMMVFPMFEVDGEEEFKRVRIRIIKTLNQELIGF